MTNGEPWIEAVVARVRDRLDSPDSADDRVRLVSVDYDGSRMRIVVEYDFIDQPVGRTREISHWRQTHAHDPELVGDHLAWDVREPPNLDNAITHEGIRWTGETDTDPVLARHRNN
ncbi:MULTISPECIES: hypothetical protein [unclassified Saccharothrix]|uniref:hypothetical protein n=1 Tax=unclassified Saccharothrix TaxID=2593673 RepID=UPI00307F0E68